MMEVTVLQYSSRNRCRCHDAVTVVDPPPSVGPKKAVETSHVGTDRAHIVLALLSKKCTPWREFANSTAAVTHRAATQIVSVEAMFPGKALGAWKYT